MGRRGYTYVEVILAATIGLAIFGLSAMFYSFTVTRSTHAMSTAAVLTEGDRLLQSVRKTVEAAHSVSSATFSMKSGLKCVMPLDGSDTDADGRLDTYRPYAISSGKPRYRAGKRVWFYFSDSTGDFSRNGPILFRAERFDDSMPTTFDVDKSWSYYYGRVGHRNYNLIGDLKWTVDSTGGVVTLTLDVSKALRGDLIADSAVSGRQLRIQRKAFWRNWRT